MQVENRAADLNHLLESEQQASSKDWNELRESVCGMKDMVKLLQSEGEEAANTRAKLVSDLESLDSNRTL